MQTSADYTLSSGTKIYPSLVPNADKINTITVPSTQSKLQYFSPEEFDILNASATQGGNPTIYTIRGYLPTGWVEFYPVPGNALTIHVDYEKIISSVSLSTDIPEIPEKYYELLIYYGEKTGLRRQKRYDIARQVDEDYQLLKQRMFEDLMRQTTQMPRIKNVREFQFGNQITTDPIANEFFGQQF